MTRTNRTIIAAWAWVAWGAAGVVTLAAPGTQLDEEDPFLVHRVFAICLVAALALTVAWLIERARRPAIPVSESVEKAYDLGVEAGKEIARMEASLWIAPNARYPMGDQIMNGKGDTSSWRL